MHSRFLRSVQLELKFSGGRLIYFCISSVLETYLLFMFEMFCIGFTEKVEIIVLFDCSVPGLIFPSVFHVCLIV